METGDPLASNPMQLDVAARNLSENTEPISDDEINILESQINYNDNADASFRAAAAENVENLNANDNELPGSAPLEQNETLSQPNNAAPLNNQSANEDNRVAYAAPRIDNYDTAQSSDESVIGVNEFFDVHPIEVRVNLQRNDANSMYQETANEEMFEFSRQINEGLVNDDGSNSNQNEWRPDRETLSDDSEANQNEIRPYVENENNAPQSIRTNTTVAVVSPNIPERILQSTRILQRISGMTSSLTEEQNSLLNTHHSLLQRLLESLGDNRNAIAQNTSGSIVNNASNISSTAVAVSESPNRKKRKRTPEKAADKATPTTSAAIDDSEDDGLTCPICLDHWEMCGLHRLSSLKCGHLFGYSCIKRWISGNSHVSRNCPTCKTKASIRDIRYIYARRVCVQDNTEEFRLNELLAQKSKKYDLLCTDFSVTKMELDLQKKICNDLKEKVELLQTCSIFEQPQSSYSKSISLLSSCKLFLEKNIDITRDPGCRVMLFGNKSKVLMVSQKSTQSLFPGFGIRFIDTPTFRPSQFVHMSCKTVRGLSFDADEELLISATMDRGAKLININTRGTVSVFAPSDKPLWSCAFDKERPKYLYLGTQHGSTYVYDIRNPLAFVEEFSQPGDLHPVINICSIPSNSQIPFGGFLVCKLQSIWFYEYTCSQQVIPTKLNIDGPFISLNYDDSTSCILISTRPNTKNPTSRYILGHLIRVQDMVTLHIIEQFNGSRVQTVMSRSTQVNLEHGCVVAAYLQDTQMLTTWGINSDRMYSTGRNHSFNGIKLQSLPVSDSVLDTCPIYINNNVFLGALTASKCRIYRFNNGSNT